MAKTIPAPTIICENSFFSEDIVEKYPRRVLQQGCNAKEALDADQAEKRNILLRCRSKGKICKFQVYFVRKDNVSVRLPYPSAKERISNTSTEIKANSHVFKDCDFTNTFTTHLSVD